MKIERKWAMPSRKTFSIKPIKELIIDEIAVDNDKVVLDPFANSMDIAQHLEFNRYISNDIDSQYPTNYHLDATEFFEVFPDNSVDWVLYDPPYSPRQVSEVYKKLGLTVNMQTTQSSYWTKQKKQIGRILKVGGKCITFGWNSGGIGKKFGMHQVRILLVAHGGWHNDTICTVEVKI